MNRFPYRVGTLARTAVLVLAAALGLSTAGCSLLAAPETEEDQRAVTLLVHDSFVMDEEVLADFQRESGIRIDVRTGGDAGELTNKLVLSQANPLGDVAYGVDSTFASRALREGVLAPRSGTDARLTPIDVADVCVNIDTRWFAMHHLPEPANLRDLADPRYRNLFAVPDPTTSSPGLAFLLNTIATFGEPAWQDYWRGLTANGAKLSAGWEEAYTQDFSGSSGNGPRPIVLSYASSPAAEAEPDGSAPTKALLDTCYRQVEYAGVLTGTDDPRAAGEVVDFLRSPRFQSRVADQMYVYPAVRNIPLPPGWAVHAPPPQQAAELDSARVERNRDRWIEQWRAVVRG